MVSEKGDFASVGIEFEQFYNKIVTNQGCNSDFTSIWIIFNSYGNFFHFLIMLGNKKANPVIVSLSTAKFLLKKHSTRQVSTRL